MQGHVFACAGQLPAEYTAAVMSGNGLAGIIAGALKIVLLLIFKTDLTKMAFVSFCTLGVFNLLSAFGYSIVFNSAFYKYWASKTDDVIVVES